MAKEFDLVLASNRGPATFELDEQGQRTVRRGGGGLVSVLSGLVRKRQALWVASSMSEEDAKVAEEHNNHSFEIEIDKTNYRLRLVESEESAYDLFYNVFANPMLWFIQHYLWDLSNAPDFRQQEWDAWDFGYQQVNRDIATAVLEEVTNSNTVVMFHDYHLYTAPALVREKSPNLLLQHFVHTPWPQSDVWRVLPERVRKEIFTGLLANDIIGFHTNSYCRNFLHCCQELFGLEIDYQSGTVIQPERETWVRAYPIAVDTEAFVEAVNSPGVKLKEQAILKRRRDHLIVRVDRADLSKNILRGFTAFDTFLEQHPEFLERVTFIAHLQPSRQDVPEYVEYLEKIEALVAVINHRHGTTDWMPIDLRLYEDLEEAVATYKHFDLLIVNSIFDGMNLVSKEGPLVNQRNGVMILSENTGSHEELGRCALSVNPFDIQQQADAIYRALTMDSGERERRNTELKEILSSRTPEKWIADQLSDIELKAAS